MFEVVDFEINVDALSILWKLLQVGSDFVIPFLFRDLVHLATEDADFFVKEVYLFMMAIGDFIQSFEDPFIDIFFDL